MRLFLRKSAKWHRINRLDYKSDVSDPKNAIHTLQALQVFPQVLPPQPNQVEERVPEEVDIIFGEKFAFADSSEKYIDTIEEAVGLLSLDELKTLAKETKINGRTKTEIARAFCRNSSMQTELMSHFISQISGANPDTVVTSNSNSKYNGERTAFLMHKGQKSTVATRYLYKILQIVGPCIRLSEPVYKLFERVHLVFYRSTEWSDKSLITIILAKISRRNFPQYIVDRSSNIFSSRAHLLEYEAGVRLESRVDSLLEGLAAGQEMRFHEVISIFNQVYPRWKMVVAEETIKETVYEFGEGSYLRRFNAAHSYTRIMHKAAYTFGRLKDHLREHELLCEMLSQTVFYPGRRGYWYVRKALLEEHYMHFTHPDGPADNGGSIGFKEDSLLADKRIKYWKQRAAQTCQVGLQDRDCHLIYHYDLQKRLIKLERALKIPRREQHDFGHVILTRPEEHVVKGVQVKSLQMIGTDQQEQPAAKKRGMSSTKTWWVDKTSEFTAGREIEANNRVIVTRCSVEEMCLNYYRNPQGGGWKGYHTEGGIVRTLFAYLFYDILFGCYVPNVFQTAYQAAPLDLFSGDGSFYSARMGAIEARLAALENDEGEIILRRVWQEHHERRTTVVGLNWDFDVEDLAQLVNCFPGGGLAAVCKVFCQEYIQRSGGVPDLLLWRTEPAKEVMFVEVKSKNDRLSDTQRLWIHVLCSAGVRVAQCRALAQNVKLVDD